MSLIMRRSPDKCVIFLTLVLFIGCASANHLMKRQSEPDGGLAGLLQSLKDMSEKIPVVGSTLGNLIQKGIDGYNKLQSLTNGAVGRSLGGAFPCTFYADKGIACSGVSTESDLSDLIGKSLDMLPSLVLPGPIKDLIVFGADMFIEPAIDVMFGGRATDGSV